MQDLLGPIKCLINIIDNLKLLSVYGMLSYRTILWRVFQG